MNLLHIDASILGPNSTSRALSAAVVARLTAITPDLSVTHLDLVADPIPHLTIAEFGAMMGGESPLALEQLLAADIVVMGAPVYNFSVPSQLKAWVDRIAVAGKTFRYTEKGPEGLLGGKRVILAIARGGLYGPGSPAAPHEHGETYLRSIFGFLGVTDVEVIVAEGLRVSDAMRDAAMTAAHAKIAKLDARPSALAAA